MMNKNEVIILSLFLIFVVSVVVAEGTFKEKETKDYIKMLDKANQTKDNINIIDVCEQNGLYAIQTDSFLIISGNDPLQDLEIKNKDCSKTLKIK